MDLNFDEPINELVVSLSQADIQDILVGQTVSKSTRRRLAELIVSVKPDENKNFQVGLPFGDVFYRKKLRGQVASASIDGPNISIKLPRILLAADQSSTEKLLDKKIARKGHHPFKGGIRLLLEDVTGMEVSNSETTLPHDGVVLPDEQ